MVEDGDQAGRDWCEEKGYPGYTSYASLNDLPHRAPAFSDLIKVLDKSAEDFARAVCWQLGSGRLVCDSLWINILGEGGNHSGHIHPNSIISGTCYITMPEGAGAIRFEDPRLGLMMAASVARCSGETTTISVYDPQSRRCFNVGELASPRGDDEYL